MYVGGIQEYKILNKKLNPAKHIYKYLGMKILNNGTLDDDFRDRNI